MNQNTEVAEIWLKTILKSNSLFPQIYITTVRRVSNRKKSEPSWLATQYII